MFNLCYFSNGGFTFNEVYDLPVLKRKFFLKMLKNVKEQEKNAAEGETPEKRPPPTPDRYKTGNYDFNQITKKS